MLALCALAGTATLASAQSARGSQRVANPVDLGFLGATPVAPTVAALVLEHAADLALADSQRVLIESIRRAQDSANRPWMLKLDSLRPTRIPANGPNDLSQEQRDEIEARRAAVAEVKTGMSGTNALARQKVMAALAPAQQRKAEELEKKALKKTEEETKRRERGSGIRRG